MRKITLLITAMTLMSGAHALGADASVFGRYVGTLRQDRLNQEQLAKLDFVVGQNENNRLELKAVLSLQFGDFVSGEYIAYHFDNVQYNLLLGTLTFDQSQEGVTITSSRFSSGEFIGELHSAALGKVGSLRMKLGQGASPILPIVETISGEYAGICKGEKVRVQLHTMRSMQEGSRIGNPFGAYEIKGQYGILGDLICKGMDPTRPCERFAIQNGSYNFYSGILTLVGDIENLVCKVDDRGMSCENGCRYERISEEKKSRVFNPPQSVAVFAKEPVFNNSGAESLSGKYLGYLHHEYLNRYQPVQFDAVTYQEQKGGEKILKISTVATLSFGSDQSAEKIAYRFIPREFPNPLVKPRFILSGLENNVDAFLKITAFGNGIVRGEWMSMIFGRVGTFEVRKESLPAIVLPADADRFKELSAKYDEKLREIQLRVFQNRNSADIANPFFPLDIGGWIRLKSGGAREPLFGGSYDFYTGKIGIKWGEDRWLIGKQSVKWDLEMIPVTNVFGSLMPSFNAPSGFSQVKESGF